MRPRRRIRQIDIDFLCLSIFGQRQLPDDMAERIATRREFYDAVKDPLARADVRGVDADEGSSARLEAVVA